jgi:hypothetical protein
MNKLRTQRCHEGERGIALLITLLVMTVLLGISASLMNITLKQYQFASIGYASETAFQAANAGMECALFHDYERYPTLPGKFDIGEVPPPITCFEVPDNTSSASSPIDSGEAQTYQFTWGDPSFSVCSEISIYKYFDADNPVDMENSLRQPKTCPAGVTCTVIQSRGYNVACGSINSPRTIERELTQRY